MAQEKNGWDASFQGSLRPMPKENDNRSPVALEQRGVSADQRMFSPSAARNLEPILEVLRVRPETSGRIAEFSEHEAD